ncbi:MAG: carboxypeptidase regulatory-like domain-containing protein [Ignavibacteria bacterium]|nr:carboxypeptidase regulatory-like domain-containing protein [Ignavibacteria bacterium]
MRYSIILLLIIFCPGIYAQTVSDSSKAVITGNVYSEKENKLSGVPVEIIGEEDKYTVNTDGSGKYRIELEAGTYEIKVVYPEYNIYSFRNLSVSEGEEKYLIFFSLRNHSAQKR